MPNRVVVEDHRSFWCIYGDEHRVAAKFIILNRKFLVLNAQFLVCNTKFIVFYSPAGVHLAQGAGAVGARDDRKCCI